MGLARMMLTEEIWFAADWSLEGAEFELAGDFLNGQ